jgi:hypothetical protein
MHPTKKIFLLSKAKYSLARSLYLLIKYQNCARVLLELQGSVLQGILTLATLLF